MRKRMRVETEMEGNKEVMEEVREGKIEGIKGKRERIKERRRHEESKGVNMELREEEEEK